MDTTKKSSLMLRYLSLSVLSSSIILSGCNSEKQNNTVKLRIIETTDIHMNLMNYDYYKNISSQKLGLTLTATLIKQARTEVNNSVLIDNGDLLQGSPMGDYIASKGIKMNETHL